MARSETLRVDGRLDEGQERPGGEDRAAAHDDCSVVELGLRHEDGPEEIDRQVSVDHDAALGDFLETGVALQHDERPMTVTGHEGSSSRHLGRHVLGRGVLAREEPRQRTDPTNPVQCSTQLRLEDDHQGKQANDRPGLQDLGEEAQRQRLRHEVDAKQNADPDHKAHCTSSPDQAEQPVDQERSDPDVEQRRWPNLIEDRREDLRHRRASVASRTRFAGRS